MKTALIAEGRLDTGGSAEIRTRDQRIKSPLLYRLSYRPGKGRDYSEKAALGQLGSARLFQ